MLGGQVMADGINRLDFGGVDDQISEARISGAIIVRRNGHVAVSFNFYATTNRECFVESAGIPLEVRTWKELNGLTIKDAGDQPGDAYYFFDGSEHHSVLSNTWSFQQLEANRFHVSWHGKWDHIPGNRKGRQPFNLSAEATFTGIRVAGWQEGILDPIGVKSIDEARQLIAKHLTAEDFESDAVRTGPTKADYWFPVRV